MDRNFALYENSEGGGFALIGQDLDNDSFPSYKVPLVAPLDANLSKEAVNGLQEHGDNVSGLFNFADSEPEALRWGEVVPLSFMRDWLNHSHTVSHIKYKFVSDLKVSL